MDRLERYLKRTEKVNDCLLWLGAQTPDGYPRAVVEGNSNARLHRYIFFLVNGFYPEVCRHSCDIPLCINPEHLLDGTMADNMRDRHERNRTHNQVDPKRAEEVIRMKDSGLTYRQISEILGITVKQAEAWNTRMRKESY